MWPSMSRGIVYVYNGLGASEESLSMLWRTLNRLLNTTKYQAEYISPEQVKTGVWCENAAVLAVGGGYDLGFIEALGDRGMAVIKDYVKEGGRYLGLCAGAYFACDSIQFDKGGPLEVCGERQLKFYSGQCIGPVFPGFKYKSHAGACSTRISWSPSTKILPLPPSSFACYYNGGGYFTAPKTNSCRILAVYDDLPNTPAAIVHCDIGNGKVVLCGMHPEYTADDLDHQDPYLDNIIPVIRENEGHCRSALVTMLQTLGLDMNSSRI